MRRVVCWLVALLSAFGLAIGMADCGTHPFPIFIQDMVCA